ncbi:MAG: hypothetical protein RIM84_07055 [Alphaproteobacteria bacterium]
MDDSEATRSTKDGPLFEQLTTSEKIGILTTHLQIQANNLHYLTSVDLRVFGGFIAIQLILGGWLAAAPDNVDLVLAACIIEIDTALTYLCSKMLHHDRRRRGEVVKTLDTTNEALGLEAVGVYLPGKKINPDYEFTPWRSIYIKAIGVAYLGILLIFVRNWIFDEQDRFLVVYNSMGSVM